MRKEHGLIIIGRESVRRCAQSISIERAIRDAFVAIGHGNAELFEVSVCNVDDTGTLMAIKPGVDRDNSALGMKVGTYWPRNNAAGLANHGSTTVLFNLDTGAPYAILNTSELNALRTAAADAVAVDALARREAGVLALLGAGHQGEHEVRAICGVRGIRSVRIWNRTRERAWRLADSLGDMPAVQVTVEDDADAAVAAADIVVTATASAEALFSPNVVRPGTHISAMGADAVGKQELDPRLVAGSRLFADHPPQSGVIGEFQHAIRLRLVAQEAVTAIGRVLTGDAPGRNSEDEVTIFDSSGLAIQDINVARAIVDECLRRQDPLQVEF